MDMRENILQQIAKVCAKCAVTKRMAVTLHQSERPAIVLNDGDESIEMNKGGKAPLIVTLRPQVILIVLDADNPGGAINKLRAKVLKAILLDDTLAAMLHPHGAIRYIGCETHVARGETMEADMALNFEVNYRLTPADL